MIKNKHLSPNQIVEVYDLFNEGLTSTSIMKKLGLNSGWTASNCFKQIKNYLVNPARHGNKQYLKARDIILARRQTEQPVQPEQSTIVSTNGKALSPVENSQETDLAALDHAFSHLQETIVTVIENEANRRSGGKVRAIKDKYEAELLKMQTILVEAKNSSVVGLLRKKWGLAA